MGQLAELAKSNTTAKLLTALERQAARLAHIIDKNEADRPIAVSIREIAKLQQDTLTTIGQIHQSLAQDIKTLAQATKALDKPFPKPPKPPKDRTGEVLNAVSDLKVAISAVPPSEIDLSPLLAAIESVKTVPVVEPSDESWTFQVEREDFSDKIKEIVATRTT